MAFIDKRHVHLHYTMASPSLLNVFSEDGHSRSSDRDRDREYGSENQYENLIHVYKTKPPLCEPSATCKFPPVYKIDNYISDYCPNLVIPLDNNGKKLPPTLMIHNVFESLKDVLTYTYNNTTSYKVINYNKGIYSVNKVLDDKLAPIVKQHIVQLRKMQIAFPYNRAKLTEPDVYKYLCSQNVPDLCALIKYFAEEWILDPKNSAFFKDRTKMCFYSLHMLLAA